MPLKSAPFIYRPIATGLTGLATTTGAVAGSIVGGFVALVYPRPAGEGSDITPDTPNVMNVRVDDETASGEIYADGEPTGINVEPTGIDEHGIPTGYTPATDADAEALSELTGTQISVGDTIGTPDAADSVNGTEETAAANIAATLPVNPDDLLEQGYTETSHPSAAANGHRTFVDPDTGQTIRYDEAADGAEGHAGRDHFHIYNPDRTGRHDTYLDENGNPVAVGSNASHIYPND